MEKSLKLKDIFNERIFRIPDYQRGYAWRDHQLNDFWEDLEDLPANKSHYTGALFIEKSEEVDVQDRWIVESGCEKFDVVDGQQRLTSIIILLNELISALGDDEGYAELTKEKLLGKYIFRESLNKNRRSYIFNYMVSDQNYQHMIYQIFRDAKALAPTEYNAYARNLDYAKTFFSKKVSTLTYEKRELLFSKVTNSLIFDLRKVDKDLDVQAVFETMNNRGKKLTILERLKNRLVYLCKFLGATDDDILDIRTKINNAWRIAYKELAKNPNEILDEDEFFIAHLSIILKPPKESVFSYETAEAKIFEIFSTRPERYDEEIVTFPKIDKYLVSLSEVASLWFRIHNSERNGYIKKILRLTSARDVKILLMAVLKIENNPETVDRILGKIEELLFRNRVPGLEQYDERELSTWARKLFNREESIDQFDRYISGVNSAPVNNEAFINGFNNLFMYVRGNYGFHRWNGLKYFLYCYDDKLRAEYKEQYTKLDYDNFDSDSIEHVVPQEWRTNWSNVFDHAQLPMSQNDELHRILINSLGNLTILFNGKNSSLGNDPWPTKNARYKTGSYNEVEISKNPSWDLAEIHLRGMKLLGFMEEKVRVLSLTESEKMRALYFKDEIISAAKMSERKLAEREMVQ